MLILSQKDLMVKICDLEFLIILKLAQFQIAGLLKFNKNTFFSVLDNSSINLSYCKGLKFNKRIDFVFKVEILGLK